MRIAIVYDLIYPYVVGGVQLRNWELAKRLVQRGHQVTLFGMKHWDGDDVIVKEGVKLHGVCPPKQIYAKGRRTFWPPIYVSYRLLPRVRSGEFDIIDVSNFPYFPCFSSYLARIGKRSRLVVTWIEVWNHYWFEYLGNLGLIARFIERLCSRIGDATAAISEMTRSALLELGHRRHIEVIPCGVDISRITAAPEAHERYDVIFFGRLIKEKNVDLLIYAISRVAREVPDVRCLIVGEGPERPTIDRLIDDLGLARNVRMIPFLADHGDVFSYMKASKVLVLPSSREGFGITAIEANACGIPVITTRYPRNACCELIRDHENGFVCEPSPEAIAEKTIIAMSGALTREDCIRRAQPYDWHDVTTSLEAFYRRQLDGVSA